MLANSPQAMALSKQAVWGSVERGYRDALESAWALLRQHWASSRLPGGAARLRREARAALEPGPARPRRGRGVNFDFTPEQEAFRAEVVEFLADWRDLDAFFLQGRKWPEVCAPVPRDGRARLALARLAGAGGRRRAAARLRVHPVGRGRLRARRAQSRSPPASSPRRSRAGERRSSSGAGCRRSAPARSTSRSATPSRRPARTSPACAAARSGAATPTS